MRYQWVFAAFLLIVTPSFAMTKKLSPPPPPPSTDTCSSSNCCFDTRWSGFTVGLTAGALINASEGATHPGGDFLLPANIANNPQRTDTTDMHGAGFVGGVQVGGNYQMKVVVVGAETDFNYCSLKRTHERVKTLATPLSGTMTDHISQLFNWFGTARGRVGLAFKPVLIYATGGLAYGHVSSKTSVRFSSAGDQYAGSRSKWRTGTTLGGGLEWGFTRHWSLKSEYLFIDLNKIRYEDPNVPPPARPSFQYKSSMETSGHIIRIGVNYTV